MAEPRVPVDLRQRANAAGSKVAERMLEKPLRSIGLVGAALLLAATAAFGGLRPQTAPTQGTTAVGETVAAAPFEITVTQASWISDLPDLSPTPGHRWIAVQATIRNTSDASATQPLLLEAVTLADGTPGVEPQLGFSGQPGLTATTVVSTADSSALNPIQPGVTYRAALLFEQDITQEPPAELTLLVQGHTWGTTILDPIPAWRTPTTLTRITIPVRKADGEA